MTTPIMAAGLPQSGALPQATQNLFEHAAQQARSMPESAGPAQLGQEVLQSLEGFIKRSGGFAERARNLTLHSPPAAGGEFASVDRRRAGAADRSQTYSPAPPVDQKQMDRVIDSLSMIFNHSIETQLVVRGTTQISGAANTLLRGQ
ncbi:hypothetical protein ELG83_24320 (plasmid) [Rhizobium leguminosarum]|uniref:hypothetical protein n=1 Tax=Rhizobium TaxID=379 RepID=UPI001030BFEE|nr:MULTISPECIES: hypothetical protein [Rhizobium]MBY5378372.1 hypothetical protein [Rhizobium leguminosarum]TBF35122.1 hypothetical protein ELG88_07770 [Rhizobium leguminosarum]TBF87978.1 hypothetical protein ELG83_24320 [Rhizobium leguminosarum]WSH48662.1 hypothetical protein U8P77_35730 [Rhizobium johnstonii]